MTKVTRIPRAPQHDDLDPELGVRITKLERCEDGYWRAHITVLGKTYAVDRRFGSWRITPSRGRGYRQLLPEFAAAIQARVRTIERSEARQEAKAA